MGVTFLRQCCATKSIFLQRVVHPSIMAEFAGRFDEILRGSLKSVLSTEVMSYEGVDWSDAQCDTIHLPPRHAGIGINCAVATHHAAFTASLADSVVNMDNLVDHAQSQSEAEPSEDGSVVVVSSAEDLGHGRVEVSAIILVRGGRWDLRRLGPTP